MGALLQAPRSWPSTDPDHPNQLNNMLACAGLLRGMLDSAAAPAVFDAAPMSDQYL